MSRFLFAVGVIAINTASSSMAQTSPSDMDRAKRLLYYKYQKGISEVSYTLSLSSYDPACAVDAATIDTEIQFILNQSKLRFRRFSPDEYANLRKKIANARGTSQEPALADQLRRLIARPSITLVFDAAPGPSSTCIFDGSIKVAATLTAAKVAATGVSFDSDGVIWVDQSIGWSPPGATTQYAKDGLGVLLKTYLNAVSEMNR
jgi:hypothetical protein